MRRLLGLMGCWHKVCIWVLGAFHNSIPLKNPHGRVQSRAPHLHYLSRQHIFGRWTQPNKLWLKLRKKADNTISLSQLLFYAIRESCSCLSHDKDTSSISVGFTMAFGLKARLHGVSNSRRKCQEESITNLGTSMKVGHVARCGGGLLSKGLGFRVTWGIVLGQYFISPQTDPQPST